MDDNTWRFAQLIMWLIGIQTTILLAAFRFVWKSLSNRIDNTDKKIDKLDEKITDIDRRICRLEGAFASKDCCMIKDHGQLKNAE